MTEFSFALNYDHIEIKHPIPEFINETQAKFGHLPQFHTLAGHADGIKKLANDAFAKQILCSYYGDYLAIQFREWVRTRIKRAKISRALERFSSINPTQAEGLALHLETYPTMVDGVGRFMEAVAEADVAEFCAIYPDPELETLVRMNPELARALELFFAPEIPEELEEQQEAI